MLGFIEKQTAVYSDQAKQFQKIIIEAQVITFANKIAVVKFKSERKPTGDIMDQVNGCINDAVQLIKIICDIRIAASKKPSEAENFKQMKNKIVNPLTHDFEVAGYTGGGTSGPCEYSPPKLYRNHKDKANDNKL